MYPATSGKRSPSLGIGFPVTLDRCEFSWLMAEHHPSAYISQVDLEGDAQSRHD